MTHPTAGSQPVAAIIAAAGRSTRMGTPKQLLPWQGATLLGAVIDHLAEAGAGPIVVVVGHEAEAIRAALAGADVQFVANPDYQTSEMLSSHQTGLRHLLGLGHVGRVPQGALLAQGDQPHIAAGVIWRVIEQARQTPHAIVIPSYAKRRGHPIYLPAGLWIETLALGPTETLRDLINRHEDAIRYVEADSPAVLRDIDTPDDYAALKAGG